MYSLFEADELWGHRPLFLFAAAWGLFLLSIGGRYSKLPKNWRWLGLSTLSGVVLSLGFPPIPLTFLMFLGFVPLLLIEKEIADEYEKPNKKLLLKYAYNTFVIWNILTTWWVGNTAFVAGIVAIWLNAFFMCIPFILFHQSKKYIPRLALPAFISYWLAFEWVHLNWEISWTWLSLGNAFAQFPSWVQWYEYTGVFGGSLWILLANYLIFQAISPFLLQKEKIQIRTFAKPLGLMVLPVLASLFLYFNYEEKGNVVEVVVAQPNYEPHYQKFSIPKATRDRQLLAMAEESVTENTRFFILPETVFGNLEEDKPEKNTTVKIFQPFLKKYPNLKIVSGANAHKFIKKGEEITSATRTRLNPDGSIRMQYESLNAAIQIQSGQKTQTYRKSKFVPGAELLPYRSVFFWLKPLVDKLGGSMEGLGTQPERSVFSSADANVAPVICYESVFGQYHSNYIRKGADLIAIMTNDGWWDNTAGHKQHLAFARLRAIETRRDIARSANTGISAFINQRGDIFAQTKYDERATLSEKVHLNKEITFYVRWQDLIARIALFTAMILLMNTVVKGKVPSEKK